MRHYSSPRRHHLRRIRSRVGPTLQVSSADRDLDAPRIALGAARLPAACAEWRMKEDAYFGFTPALAMASSTVRLRASHALGRLQAVGHCLDLRLPAVHLPTQGLVLRVRGITWRAVLLGIRKGGNLPPRRRLGNIALMESVRRLSGGGGYPCCRATWEGVRG
jgi:hypothetical protein